MKNITNEKPTDKLSGRALFCTKFISDAEVTNANILDIGCGYGWLEVDLAKRGCKKVIGMEYEEKGLITAKKYIHNKSTLFDTGSAIALPYENNCFDTVISLDVIEHIPKNTEEKMFSEAYRVLKNNGKFYISTPSDNFFGKILDPAWILAGHRHYNIDYLIALGKKVHFEIKKTVIKGGWWEIIYINNLYIAKWLFHRQPFFKNFLEGKNNDEYKKKGFYTVFLCFSKIRKGGS